MWRKNSVQKSSVRVRLLAHARVVRQQHTAFQNASLQTAQQRASQPALFTKLLSVVKTFTHTSLWRILFFTKLISLASVKPAQVQKSVQKTIKQPTERHPKILYHTPKNWGVFNGLYDLVYPFIYTLKTYSLQTLIVLGVSGMLLSGLSVVYTDIFKDLPLVSALSSSAPISSTKILDRNGVVLFRLFNEENRTLVPLSDVPKQVIFATIAIEDKDFYEHLGFSFTGIMRAFFSNLQNDSVQGGSTITQQLVKNRLLSSERTVTRKIKELLLAVAVEHEYSKDHILEMYLNQVSYGGATYGIEEAAQRYFGKSVQELSLAEAALLAGLPQAPSVYSPFGSDPELAYARQREVLRRMTEDGYISADQAAAAATEELHFRDDVIDIKAPHFVMYVKQLLAQTYGEELLYQGGLEVRTSLDLSTQEATQKTVHDEIAALARLKVSNGAALITNPQTGEVLSMVGSTDYFDFAHDGQVNVSIRPRQPGSSIKPLTYALAFEQGFSPGTIVIDAPVSFRSAGSPVYAPKNYDKTLALVGVTSMIDKAQQLGITTWDDRKRFGLSLTLGGGEVLMTQMTQLYGSFANGGTLVPLNPILEISTYNGESIYRNTCALDGTGCPTTRVFDPRIAYMITSVLSDNAARTPAFGPLSTLVIPNQEVAVKTGTTNNLRDNWTFGYTKDRVVAVWVGNNDNTPMSYVVSGVTGASSIWNTLMRSQLSASEPHRFEQPPGLVKLPLCRVTLQKNPQAGDATPGDEKTALPKITSRTELYLQEKAQNATCIPSQFSVLPETSQKEARAF